MSYSFNHLDLIQAALGRSPFGLITDVDGTISPTAPTPQQAKVSPLCRRYLAILPNQLALVAAISGRPAAEVKNMINIDGIVYVGNHGLEQWVAGYSKLRQEVQDYPEVINSVIEELTPLLTMEGIIIENKGITASIHYRLCPEPELARRNIQDVLKNSPRAGRLRITQERMAIGLLPPVEANKGTAVLDLIREHNLRGGVYLGDDLTDIYAFRAIHTASHELDFRGFAIAVVSQEMPEDLAKEADFTLNGVDDVEQFLRWMSQTVAQSG